ncbi:hypothetical protein J2W42_004123 [Rhizobium tibeticum]|uniref:hypothetical protein n=1 Tax=Rhizobium tibeticum TaxID=501024 RepID=UPI002788134A|nr:hypothetical protein [Rhizobium tibeticum]MDP9811260.1 hypothetical protein [Rhizobium tibeticum]
MKNISRDRDSFALPEFLAYASISGAMRPFTRANRYSIGLVVPDWDRRVTYIRAALVVLDRELDFRFRDQVRAFDDEKAEPSIEAVLDMLQNQKTVILFKSEEAVPPDLRYALDAIVQVPPPSSRLVRGVVRWAYGISVSEQQAATLANSNWKRLKLAMTRGRPISRVFSALEKMARQSLRSHGQKTPGRHQRSVLKTSPDMERRRTGALIWCATWRTGAPGRSRGRTSTREFFSPGRRERARPCSRNYVANATSR